MSHDFLGLTTKEPLNTEKDNPLSLNQRLSEDLKNCIKQLRNFQKKNRENNGVEGTQQNIYSSNNILPNGQGNGAISSVTNLNAISSFGGLNNNNNNNNLLSMQDLQNEEQKKPVKVHLWLHDDELKENRITELDTMRSFQVNPAFLGYDTERLKNDPSQKKIRIDIAATSNKDLFKPFEIPDPNINTQNQPFSIHHIEGYQNHQIQIPKYFRHKSKRMKMGERSTIIKKGKVFTIKYLPKEYIQQE
ncbi:hypothetical protein TTHERM_00930640 (macronuclear) [Tetrahymena thermophila SB210]|uniref:Uncharacterized protein n=1 Tax=Tetrahymena thermophila (strain SB210) TaxID=312017 RepID=Q24CH7_TETTS|nr:hypothetical protein TTHERM_00930640 [Tetrahymena thermophila SB210]EAS05483.1 hypothetical protein TTHERM_00930640 [Tetrahymena thermophila SB210]|eukprot:XP_001025728.1 hypothetical protein TTHERM_00930640 [Tetrahymena thermophila SB210]